MRALPQLSWISESFAEEPSFIERAMFGCRVCYVHGRLMLVLAEGEEPWNGVMVCTAREHHAELIREFPRLVSHPVLGKWLYLSLGHEDFEDSGAGSDCLPASVKALQRRTSRLSAKLGSLDLEEC